MITYFNNPYDMRDTNRLQEVFAANLYPQCVTRRGPDDDQGFWISFLPTIIVHDGSREVCRIEQLDLITVDSVRWLTEREYELINGVEIAPDEIPEGIIFPHVGGAVDAE